MISLALSLLLVQADFQAIPVRMSGGFIAAEVHTSDGSPHWFLVDSGSNASYVAKTLANDSEIKHGDMQIRLDVGKAQVFGAAEPIDAARIPVGVGGLKTEGVLGINVLRYLQLRIDYDEQTVLARFGPALPWAGPGHDTLIMNRDADNLYTLSGYLGGRAIRLCVDTGATALVLDPKKISMEALTKLTPTKINTFGGTLAADRFLIDRMKLGDVTSYWMIASKQPWSNADDGTIGTTLLGSSNVTIDFPGSCVYVGKSDPMSQAASRILGLPVQVEDTGLRFRDRVPESFRPWAKVKILAVRRTKPSDLVLALKDESAQGAKTIAEIFGEMRTPGLLTTERNGKRELVPITIED